MSQIDINIITDTIGLYMKGASKASIFNWQLFHHHGTEGIHRAETLGRWCDTAWHNGKLEFLLDNYLGHKNYLVLANKLAHVNSRNPQEEEFKIVTAEMYADAKLLAGGNNTKSSLRYYIDSVLKSYRSTVGTQASIYQSSFRSGYFRSSIFGAAREDTNSDLTLDIADLGRFDKVLGVSEHAVHRYKKESGGKTYYYFLKYLNSDEEKSNALAEVVYSKLWRFLIGERASDSRLVFDSGSLIGICSVGLDGFKEFVKMTPNDLDETKGLASLLICVYLFMENDFHIYNYGQFNFYNRFYYGKIDHDYIVTKWNDMKPKESNFKINTLADILNQTKISLLVDALKKLRFRPTSENDIHLRFGHNVRALVSDRKVTTTNDSLASDILIRLLSKDSRDDLNRVKSSIKQRAGKLDYAAEGDMQLEIDRIGKSGDIKTEKAKEIFTFFVRRIKDLSAQIK